MNLAVKRALRELSQGNLILLNDIKGQGKLLGLADRTTPKMINFMIKNGKGLVSVGIEESRAERLGIKRQKQSHYSTEDSQAYTVSIDIEETTTGISATERHQTIAALTDSSRKAEEFKRPGHIFPIITHPEGISVKQTHTELGIELTKQADAYPAVVLCDVLNESGQLANCKEMKAMADEHSLFMLQAEDIIYGYIEREKIVKRIDEKKVTNFVSHFKLMSYSNALDSHVDYVFSSPADWEVPYVYVHKQCSQCHAMACDCHRDFQRALSCINAKGGFCLQMSYRNDRTDLANSLDKEVTNIIAAKIMKDIGVKEVRFMYQENEFTTMGELFKGWAI